MPIGLPFLPIERRSFVSTHLLRIAECRCFCVSHRQPTLLAVFPLRAEHGQLYRQDAGRLSDTRVGSFLDGQLGRGLLVHRLGFDHGGS